MMTMVGDVDDDESNRKDGKDDGDAITMRMLRMSVMSKAIVIDDGKFGDEYDNGEICM
jgi:hypothetical protein